jgi:hypothetical protein
MTRADNSALRSEFCRLRSDRSSQQETAKPSQEPSQEYLTRSMTSGASVITGEG